MIDINTLTSEQLAQLIDHTLLAPNANKNNFVRLCSEAKQYHFKMVAINPYPVKLCKEILKDSDIHVGAAIAFPLGQTTIESKCSEAKQAIDDGADEIDYVINVSKVKDKDYDYIQKEMEQLVKLGHDNNVIVKAIFENCYLDKAEIINLASIARSVKPDYIKTSTGFGPTGASVQDVRLMKETVGDLVKIKAAGGIRDWQTCKEMLLAGADRMGTSSSIKIMQEFKTTS